MSWRATCWAADQKTGSPITKLVLFKLADNANDKGICWPSIRLMANDCELSERTVQQHLQRLEVIKLIRIERREGEGGASLSNRYHLAMHGPVSLPGEGAASAPPPVSRAPEAAPAAPQGESGGKPYKEEPSIEPSIEPPLTAPAGAGKGGDVHQLGKGQPELFEQFRFVIAETWPGGFPAENEIHAKGEFAKATRSHEALLIIDCARLQGQAYTKRQAGRSKSQGALQVPRPGRWLAEGQWKGWIEEAGKVQEAEGKQASALARVRRALGSEAFAILQDRMAMPDAAIALLDGVTFEQDPPRFMVTSHGARVLLDNRLFALQRAFGEDLRIIVVPAVKSA